MELVSAKNAVMLMTKLIFKKIKWKKQMPKKIYRFYADPDPTRTKFLMDKQTGKLKGRRLAKKGERSDQLLNIRVKKPSEASGQIFGFLPSGVTRIPVKASSTSRATTRKVVRRTF